jgi:hypothetical protein
MGVMTPGDDFFEPDEPLEDVVAAFEQGEKGKTRPPTQGRTEYLVIGVQSQGRTEYLTFDTVEQPFLPLDTDTRLRSVLTVDLVSS